MSSEELRPRPIPQAAQPKGALNPDQLPGDGRPPLRAGKVYFSDYTKKQLTSVGWKEGDPIPGDLGRRLQQIQDEVIAERETARLEDSELAAGWEPVKGDFVDIEKLPPARRAEIQQYLAEYKQQVAQDAADEQAAAAIEAKIPPNIQGDTRNIMRQQIATSEAMLAAREQRQPLATSEVIDDRVPPVPIPEGKTFGGVLGDMGPAAKIEELKRRAQAAKEAPPEEPVHVHELPATGVTTHTHCNRCMWPLDAPFEIKPTDEDKQRFLAAVLGLGRFEKQYELLGGNLKVVFRSLTSEESAMIQNQLGLMTRFGAIKGDGEYWANLHDLRLAVSCKRMIVGEQQIYDLKPLKDWAEENPRKEGDPEEFTPLLRLRDYFYEKGATQEPVRMILGQTHREFQRLVEMLEVMTSDSDFWKGIALPA